MEYKPQLRMGELRAFTIDVQYFLILLFNRIAVYVVKAVKRTGGRGNRLHTHLKKSRKLF